MRIFAALLLATLTLAACSKKPPEATQAAAPAPSQSSLSLAAAVPNMNQASYSADVTIRRGADDASMPVSLQRDHAKLRIQLEQGVAVSNPDAAASSFMLVEMGGQQVAMTMDDENAPWSFDRMWRREAGDVQIRALGPCAAAGESGAEFEQAASAENTDNNRICITSDGILLRASKNGRAIWEMTALRRGPQDPSLFVVPPGVRVMNLGPGAQQALRAALEKAKSRATP